MNISDGEKLPIQPIDSIIGLNTVQENLEQSSPHLRAIHKLSKLAWHNRKELLSQDINTKESKISQIAQLAADINTTDQLPDTLIGETNWIIGQLERKAYLSAINQAPTEYTRLLNEQYNEVKKRLLLQGRKDVVDVITEAERALPQLLGHLEKENIPTFNAPLAFLTRSVASQLLPSIFDLEGTLVDLEKLHQVSLEQAAREMGIDFGPEQFQKFVGAGDQAISEAIAKMAKEKGMALDPKTISDLKKTIYLDLLNSHPVQPREGVPEYLEQARMEGDLVVATLTPIEQAEDILKRSGLRSFFTHVLTLEDVTKRKPHPEVFYKAARLLNATLQQTVVHEDSPVGAKAIDSVPYAPYIILPVHPMDKLTWPRKPGQFAYSLTWKNLTPEEAKEFAYRHRIVK